VLKRGVGTLFPQKRLFLHTFSKKGYENAVLKKRCGNAVPTPNEKAEPNNSNKVGIRPQEFPHWMVLFHCYCQLLTSSANLPVASPSVRSQPCFSVIFWIPHLQVTLLVQKGVGTRSHAKRRCGNAVPTRSHPTIPLHIRFNSPTKNKEYVRKR